MSIGFQPQIPLSLDSENGFALTKTLKTNIKQNLKMLILTNPGERIFVPNFGVGVRNFLFESIGQETFLAIDSKIREQASLYMSFLNIERVQFMQSDVDSSKINIKVTYTVPRVGLTDTLFTNIL